MVDTCEVEEEEEEVEMEEEEGEGEEEVNKDTGIMWGQKVSAKRKEREDFWIDAELEVRQICGYKERKSKKVIRRIKDKEVNETRDIRDMMGREEQEGTSGVDKETEEELDYEEEGGRMAKKLVLGWEGLEQPWKMAIGRRAKDVRNCHSNYR